MVTAATVIAKLILDSTEYKKGLAKVKTDTQTLSKDGGKSLAGLSSAFQSVTGFSLGMAGAVGIAGVALQKTAKFLNECEQAANEANVVMAKQEAILKATGYAAGVTSDQLQDMASSSSKLTGIDDELIATAQSMLLTFRNIKSEGDVFERAQNAALDLQTTFGGLEESAKQVGMALNDFGGYTRLQRSGVTFSDEQKKQIANYKETNDLMGYQLLLLSEIENQVGGTAAAMEAASDGTAKLAVATENYKEAVGQNLVDLKRDWNDYWSTVFNDATEELNFLTKIKQLGFEQSAMGDYWQNGMAYSEEQVRMIIAYSEGIDAEAIAVGNLGDEAGLTADQMDMLAEAESKVNQGAVDMVASFSNIDQSYQEKLSDINEELKSGAINTEEWTQKTKELADEHELATHKIILGYIEQQLAIGGLSDTETEFLLAKGVEWGIYSDTAIAEMRAVQAEWAGFDPGNKSATFTVTTYYNDSGTSSSGLVIRKPGEAVEGARALGGSTIAGGMYEVAEGGKPELYSQGDQTYLLTGSQGGMVTPAKSNSQSQGFTSTDYKAFGNAMVVALQQAGLV